MNEKVQDLINQEIERLDALKKKERDEHLISLGLTDKKKANANTMIITFLIQNGIRKRKCFLF